MTYTPVKPQEQTFFDSFETEDFLFREKFFELYSGVTSNFGVLGAGNKETCLGMLAQVDGLCLFVLPKTSPGFKEKIKAIDKKLEIPIIKVVNNHTEAQNEVKKLIKEKVEAVSNEYYTILSKKPSFRLG